MNKVLVLGSTPFVGSCLVDYLLSKNVIVYGISRSNERKLQKYKYNKI